MRQRTSRYVILRHEFAWLVHVHCLNRVIQTVHLPLLIEWIPLIRTRLFTGCWRTSKRAKAESQRDDALAQVEALQARLDDREGKLTAERRASQSRIAASQERAQQVRDAYDELLALAREKEAQRMTWEKQARERAAALRTCVERNEALFSAGREILDAYQNLGSGSLFRMRQPLAASARVEFENQAQAFGDRLYNNQVQVTETSSDDGEQTDQSEEARNNE